MAQVNDRRRSRWITWDVHFLDGPTGSAIYERFGFAGVALFAGFLSACKRNSVQGQFAYGSDADGLAQMGYPGAELVDGTGSAFTLDDYWTLTGRLKQTSRRRRGRVTYVTSTNWAKWQQNYGTRKGDEEKGRSGAGNTDEKPDASSQDATELLALDPDSDHDPDKDRDNDRSSAAEPEPKPAIAAPAEVPTLTRRRDELWEAVITGCGLSGTTPTKSERGAWNKAVADLRAAGATPLEVFDRCAAYRDRWPNVSLTPTALARRWNECMAGPKPNHNGGRNRPPQGAGIDAFLDKRGLAGA